MAGFAAGNAPGAGVAARVAEAAGDAPAVGPAACAEVAAGKRPDIIYIYIYIYVSLSIVCQSVSIGQAIDTD